MIGKRAVGELAVGDQYFRVEDPEAVWTVQRVVELPKLPKHAVMSCATPAPRQIMVSVVVLRDRRLYRQVPVPQAAGTKDSGRTWAGLRWLFGR